MNISSITLDPVASSQPFWHIQTLQTLDSVRILTNDFVAIFRPLVCGFCIALCLYYMTGSVTYYMFKRIFKSNIISEYKRRVLFVTAHPDDECMFFGPTIISLRQNCDVYLLCLTTGNFCNKGSERKRELLESCEVLGIPIQNIMLMDITKMPDDPSAIWNPRTTSKILLDHIEVMMFHEVYTFDIGGVSGHLNHSSVFLGFAHMCLHNEVPSYCKVYTLETVNVLRKYSVFADALFSSLSSPVFLVSLAETRQLRDAMSTHMSQRTWYRALYMYFSRYVYMNTYKELDREDVQLVLQMSDYNSLL